MRIKPHVIHAKEPWSDSVPLRFQKPKNQSEIDICLSCSDPRGCKHGECEKIRNLRRRRK